jgi:hypothetical protein
LFEASHFGLCPIALTQGTQGLDARGRAFLSERSAGETRVVELE